ncbi:MAG: hypothetical protein RRB13_01835 [bacterium]|nr:hypothetical protein [bacterium]
MAKKIALITRHRQAEAMRMALGLTLLEDEAEVFILQDLLDDDATANQLRQCQSVDLPVYCTAQGPAGLPYLDLAEAAQRWTQFDRLVTL